MVVSHRHEQLWEKIFEYKGNIWAQLIWILVFLVLTALTIILIQTSIGAYLEYGVTSAYSVVYEVQSQFPTLTVCAGNPFLAENSFDLLNQTVFNNNIDLLTDMDSAIKLAKMQAANPSFGDQNRKKLGLSLDMIVSC